MKAARGSESSGSWLRARVSWLGSASLAWNSFPEAAREEGLPELVGTELAESRSTCKHVGKSGFETRLGHRS